MKHFLTALLIMSAIGAVTGQLSTESMCFMDTVQENPMFSSVCSLLSVTIDDVSLLTIIKFTAP